MAGNEPKCGRTPGRTQRQLQRGTKALQPSDSFPKISSSVTGDFPEWRLTPSNGEFGPGARPESLSRGESSGQEGDGVDLDVRVQQQAGDLHGGAGGRVCRKELSADAGEHSVGTEVCQIGLDADDMVHAGAEFAKRIADALECHARLLFECDAAF